MSRRDEERAQHDGESAVTRRDRAVQRRGGFVLIAALWLIVAISAVALDAAVRSRPARLAAANRLDDMRAREAALAGSEYARARLSAAMLERADEMRAEVARQGGNARTTRNRLNSLIAADDSWYAPHELVPQGMALGEAVFELTVHDVGISLNLNEASEDMLRNFLSQGLRVDYAAADRLTQAILDWRDDDDLPRINGAEQEQYLDEGLPVLPPNRPFAEVDELRHVMGMTPELFEAMQPYLTVVGSGRINLNAAPEAVLFAVPFMTRQGVSQLLRVRGTGQAPRNSRDVVALIPGFEATGRDLADFNRRITFVTNEVEVVSVGRTEGSPVSSTVRSVLSRSDQGAILLWRRLE